jgi:integrase
MATGDYIAPAAGRILINELGSEWLQHQIHLKPSTFRTLEIAWRRHVQPIWGKVPAVNIRYSDVQSWVTNLGTTMSPTSVLRAYGVLAGILDVAVKDRRLQSNPARGVNLPRKVSKQHRYLSHQQVRDLAIHSSGHEMLVYLLAYTGVRWGEAVGLRARDLDADKRRLNITVNAVEVGGQIEVGTPKTHKRRAVAIPDFLLPALVAQCAGKNPDDLIFSGRYGEHLRRTRVSAGSRSWFKTALVDAGLEPMTLHDLRHTAASLAISAGANVKAVQRMLGHASAAVTLDVYSDLFDADVDAVAARLDEARLHSVVGKMWANGNSAE